MTEQQLKDRLAGLVDDQPPMRQGSADDLQRGRRRVRRRRLGALAATTALASGGVVLVSTAPWQADSQVRFEPGPAAGSTGTSSTIERCTHVDNGALDPSTFGPGSRIVTMDSNQRGDVNAVVLSADGRTWGSCWLSGDSSTEFNGSASAYPMTEGRPAGSASETAGMTFGRGKFWYVDRFPSNVARVTVAVGGGRVVSAPAVRGFVAFMREVPGLDMDSSPRFDVTLYDDHGTVLADKSMAKGDASLPPAYRTWVPDEPLPDGGAGR